MEKPEEQRQHRGYPGRFVDRDRVEFIAGVIGLTIFIAIAVIVVGLFWLAAS